MQIKSLLTLGAVMTSPLGVSSTKFSAQPPGPARVPFSKAGAKPFVSLIQYMVEDGARLLEQVEVHTDKRSARVATLTLQGARKGRPDDGKPVSYYREIAAGLHEIPTVRAYEKLCVEPRQLDRAGREACETLTGHGFIHPELGVKPPAKDLRQLVKTVRDGVTSKYMVFKDPAQFDLMRFLNDEAVSVASMGADHALAVPDAKGKSLENLCFQNTQRVPDDYASLPRDALDAMYDHYAKALKQGPAVLVISGTTFDLVNAARREAGIHEDISQACHAHFRSQGLLVAVVAVDDFHVTVVAPQAMKPALEKAARQYPDAVTLTGQGGSGWGTPSVKVKDQKSRRHEDL